MTLRRAMIVALALAGCNGSITPGGRCATHSDCASIKDGYCARAQICTRDCTDGGSCEGKSKCIDVGVRSVCLATCDSDTDCLTEFSCQTRDGQQTCQLKNQYLKPP